LKTQVKSIERIKRQKKRKKKKKARKLDIEVKLGLQDTIAAVQYSKGISIIHLALLIGWFYVRHPDIENIEQNSTDEECVKFGENVRFALYV